MVLPGRPDQKQGDKLEPDQNFSSLRCLFLASFCRIHMEKSELPLLSVLPSHDGPNHETSEEDLGLK